MIERFKVLMGEIFSEPKAEPVTHELELAAASLLIDVARADFHCSDRELAAAARELEACFGFDASESRGLLGRAVERHEAQTSLYPFVKLINEHCTAEEKSRLVEALWRVAFADYRVDKYEEHQIRKIAELLHVPHKDFIRAKLRTASGAGEER